MNHNKKRMAGDDEFQANLHNAQMQSEAVENSKTADAGSSQPQGGSEEKAQEFLKQKTTEISDSQRNAQIRNEIAADPGRTKERLSGLDRSKYDFEGYSDSDIVKAYQGGDFGDEDYARLTGKPVPGKDESSDNNSGGSTNSNAGGGSGGVTPRVGPGSPQQTSFAQQAIDAAKKNNPVDFKALDQRIHDRPLYMQAKADIKHSETFGDTWSWDSAPKWNLDRFKSKPMENRYEDVMDKDDDD